jgi:hypothetical protein
MLARRASERQKLDQIIAIKVNPFIGERKIIFNSAAWAQRERREIKINVCSAQRREAGGSLRREKLHIYDVF